MRTTGGTESGSAADRSDTGPVVLPSTRPPPPLAVGPWTDASPNPVEDGADAFGPERELLDLLPDAYLATDAAGRILEANAAASDLFALSRSELCGSSLLDFVAPDDVHLVAAVLAGNPSAGPSDRIEAGLRSAGGHSVIAELAARPQQRGGHRVGVRWFVRDVTRQRDAERALRDQAERHGELATQLPVLTYSLDAEHPGGVPTFVSPRMAELLGFPAHDLLALPDVWVQQIHPDDRARVLAERAGACEKISSMRCEYRVLTRDGLVRRVRDEALIMHGDGGPRVEGVVIDVTGRSGRRDDAMRVESRRGLTPSNEDRNTPTFLRLFLHDMRSPLAVAVAIVETLLREEDHLPVEQRRELLTRAVTNLEHIRHLLSEVVDIERLEQRQVAVRREPTDVRTVVGRVVAAVGDTGHPIEFRGCACLVHTDASLVERAVAKLLDNALTHTPPETGIWVGVEQVGDGALVTVEDEGIGVADALKERIFEAFDRGNAPVTTAGFGLGLALVRHIGRVLGGQTWVEDRPGGGASFRLLLPPGD
ncbi:MAG: PAS domain S-box protein [Actinomycetota bacterium]|nr:PAS domain S-box protein [Actinomycetota bacterium]